VNFYPKFQITLWTKFRPPGNVEFQRKHQEEQELAITLQTVDVCTFTLRILLNSGNCASFLRQKNLFRMFFGKILSYKFLLSYCKIIDIRSTKNLGPMLRSQFSAIFDNFRWKNLAFFSKPNVTIKILQNLVCFESKTPIFFAEFFGENILKITTSVPGGGT
jgi:hypothetical protein